MCEHVWKYYLEHRDCTVCGLREDYNFQFGRWGK